MKMAAKQVMITDGTAVKMFALEAVKQGRKVDAQVTVKFAAFLQQMKQHSLETQIQIMDEAPSKFSKEEREANPTAYQYISRLKAIWGAHNFCGMEVTGPINELSKTAKEMLNKHQGGIQWDGKKLTDVQSAKLEAKRTKFEAEALAKGKANGLKGAKLYAQVEAEVDEKFAHLEQEDERKAAARYVASIVKSHDGNLDAAADYINLLVEEMNKLIEARHAEQQAAEATAKAKQGAKQEQPAQIEG
jgi:hypothetical protein